MPDSDRPTLLQDNAINRLVAKFERVAHSAGNVEFWYARDLQILLGYSKWDSFLDAVAKAETACRAVRQPFENHFAHVREMAPIGSGAEREVLDIKLMRYACRLIAQNGDSREKPIAFAQTYFAIQTRKHELREKDEK